MQFLKICIFILASCTYCLECTISKESSSSTVSTVSSNSYEAAAPPLQESLNPGNADKVGNEGMQNLENNHRSRRFLWNEIKRAFQGRSQGQRRPFEGEGSWWLQQQQNQQSQQLLLFSQQQQSVLNSAVLYPTLFG